MTQYIEINKADLTLAFAWLAAVFAWYAWKEASAAHYEAKPAGDPITVDPGNDDSEGGGADE